MAHLLWTEDWKGFANKVQQVFEDEPMGVILNGIEYADVYQRVSEELEVYFEMGGRLCQ